MTIMSCINFIKFRKEFKEMKKVKIYTRTITTRTGYKKFQYQSHKQAIIKWNNEIYTSFPNYKVDVSKIRIPFELELDSGNKKVIISYCKTLGRTSADKFIKDFLKKILNEVKR